jgi:hypothetical protein
MISLKRKDDWFSTIKPGCYHSVYYPIPLHHLKSILEELIPKSISKKEKVTWDRRISETIAAYEAYVMLLIYAGLSKQLLKEGIYMK